MRNRVTASERAYEKYKAESGLFATGGETLSDRQVGQLNEQLMQARAKVAETRAKFEQLKDITPASCRAPRPRPTCCNRPSSPTCAASMPTPPGATPN